MKSRLIILSLAFFTFALVESNAQIDVTVNPIGLLFGDLSIGGDFILSDELSVEATLGYGSGKEDAFGLKWSNIPITVVGKYYFNPDDGADKFYGTVFLRYINRSYKTNGVSTNAEYTQSRFGLGVGIGYKVVSRKGIIFDIGFGVGRALSDNTKYSGDGFQTEIDWPEIMFTGKFGVGYRFGT